MGLAGLGKQGQDQSSSLVAKMRSDSVGADGQGLVHAAVRLQGCKHQVRAKSSELPEQLLLSPVAKTYCGYLGVLWEFFGQLACHLSKFIASADSPFFKAWFGVDVSKKRDGWSRIEALLMRAQLAEFGHKGQTGPEKE